MSLQAEGISRVFFRNGKNTNYFTAVEKTDFKLEKGCITEIIGKSGSGKTTFINMLSGLLTPSEGKVLIDDKDIYALSDSERSRLRNRYIGMVPQGQTGLQSFTVLENVLLPLIMYGKVSDKETKARELLESVGIGELSDVYSNELSGGELRRMAIVRALINDPTIIIADEPTGDLDKEATVMVMELLKQYASDGAAILIVTHDRDVVTYSDRLYTMEKGVLRLN